MLSLIRRLWKTIAKNSYISNFYFTFHLSRRKAVALESTNFSQYCFFDVINDEVVSSQ